MINQESFRKYNENKESDTFTVKLNLQERRSLDDLKIIIRQNKDSTALKQLAEIGAKVLLQDSTRAIIDTCLNNQRKNSRTGILI